MGDMSYEGAIGGFVFACPTGSVKQKLYGSTEQLPAIMYQVFQEIETEGYVCRELYVDTHSVNLSRAAESRGSGCNVSRQDHPCKRGDTARNGIC